MREIGSEFWDVPVAELDNQLFPSDTTWFISGRCALQAIIEDLKGCHSVAVPSWCCDSMIKPFVDAGLSVLFYPVYWDKGLIQEPRLDTDICLLMDYFGYSNTYIQLSGYKGIVIRDVTHSILSSTIKDADYCFGSLRKWCGVWSGGYVWTQDGHKLNAKEQDVSGYFSLRERAMKQKSEYISGKRNDKVYLSLLNQAEEMLDVFFLAPAADRDVIISKRFDVDGVRNQRRRNAVVLRRAFQEWLVFPIMDAKDCPLFVPVIVPDNMRDGLRKWLIDHEIFCPVHWPESTFEFLNDRTRFLYKSELSLVCDQRYTETEMYRIVDTINDYLASRLVF